jgi:iron complex outermembrane receptor protein
MSFNAGFNSARPEVAPEYLNSYEVGYKQTFGHTLLIDIAAFYYDYIGFQVPLSVNVGGTLQSEFINVPKAESTGIEFEGVWTPIKDLQITGTYSYDYTAVVSGCSLAAATATLATGNTPSGNLCISDTQDPNAVAPGARNILAGLQSVKGDSLVNAPRNKVAIDVAYTWHFEPGNLTVSGAYVWRDIQAGTLFNRFYYNAPSWSDVDLRAIWSGDHDRYEVIGFVKNVFNTTQHDTGAGGAALAGNTTTAGNFFVSSFNIAPPRQFGVEVRYKFF